MSLYNSCLLSWFGARILLLLVQVVVLLSNDAISTSHFLASATSSSTTRSSAAHIMFSDVDQDPFHDSVLAAENYDTDNSITDVNEQDFFPNKKFLMDGAGGRFVQLKGNEDQKMRNRAWNDDRIHLLFSSGDRYGENNNEDVIRHDDRIANMRSSNLQYTSTGTTIAGICGHDFVVLGADSRSTSNTIVADKKCYKIHPLASNVAAAGAGTAADIDQLTHECYYTMKLIQQTQNQQSMAYGNQPFCPNKNHPIRKSIADNTKGDLETLSPMPFDGCAVSVEQICRYLQDRLYVEGGSCQANLIVGGVYNGVPILRAIHPHGSSDTVQYTALGSGGYAAMSILENGFDSYYSSIITNKTKDRTYRRIRSTGMNISDAVELVVKAVTAGIINDLGSGSQVDIVIISKDAIARYKRSVVGEEKLTEGTAITTTRNKNSTTIATIGNISSLDMTANNIKGNRNGVNSFGNVPFAIKSKRIIRSSTSEQKTKIRTLWNDVF